MTCAMMYHEIQISFFPRRDVLTKARYWPGLSHELRRRGLGVFPRGPQGILLRLAYEVQAGFSCAR
jgi:hypothetical protein